MQGDCYGIGTPIKDTNTLYRVYKNIKNRCYNSNHCGYKNYGGRGVVMCDEWLNSFRLFEKWAIENGYSSELQIDRIDNNGNYEPSNCRFVTSAENKAVGKLRMSSKNKSGYIGISYIKQRSKWLSRIQLNGKIITIGSFETAEDALKARINKEIELFGKQMTNIKGE